MPRPRARPSGTSVAVIDLEDVLESPRGPENADGADEDPERTVSKPTCGRRSRRSKSLAEQLKTLKPGTPDYAAKEKELASIQADLQVQARQKSREFLEQEAQIHYESYQEIQQHVAKFCQSYGIQLVIRFNREPIDASKPQEVQMGLNRRSRVPELAGHHSAHHRFAEPDGRPRRLPRHRRTSGSDRRPFRGCRNR